MTQPPQPSTYGQIKAFLRDVHRDLVMSGYSPLVLSRMSVRKALLARYGSAEKVDQAVELGAYRGVQQAKGGRSSWRKVWVRIREEEMNRFLIRVERLDALAEAIDQCKVVGIPCEEIEGEVRRTLYELENIPLEPQDLLPAVG